MIENIILFIIGLFTGIGVSFEKFYLVFGAVIFAWMIVIIKVPIASNERIYCKVISVSIGFALGHLLEVNFLSSLVEQEIIIIAEIFGITSLIFLYGVPYLYYSWRQRRERLSCGERNMNFNSASKIMNEQDS